MLTSVILYPSDIILIRLWLINIKNNLAFLVAPLFSSNGWFFLEQIDQLET